MHILLPFRKTLIASARFNLSLIPTRDIEATGCWDLTEDGLHIPFLDYDFVDKRFLFQDLQWLQQAFRLSNFHVLATREEKINIRGKEEIIGSYHSICLDKVPFAEDVEIIQRSHCDAAFKRGAYLNVSRVWTLRIFEDYRPAPKYVATIRSPYSERQQSSAHAKLLEKKFGVPVQILKPDNLETIWLEMYRTWMKKTGE